MVIEPWFGRWFGLGSVNLFQRTLPNHIEFNGDVDEEANVGVKMFVSVGNKVQ